MKSLTPLLLLLLASGWARAQAVQFPSTAECRRYGELKAKRESSRLSADESREMARLEPRVTAAREAILGMAGREPLLTKDGKVEKDSAGNAIKLFVVDRANGWIDVPSCKNAPTLCSSQGEGSDLNWCLEGNCEMLLSGLQTYYQQQQQDAKKADTNQTAVQDKAPGDGATVTPDLAHDPNGFDASNNIASNYDIPQLNGGSDRNNGLGGDLGANGNNNGFSASGNNGNQGESIGVPLNPDDLMGQTNNSMGAAGRGLGGGAGGDLAGGAGVGGVQGANLLTVNGKSYNTLTSGMRKANQLIETTVEGLSDNQDKDAGGTTVVPAGGDECSRGGSNFFGSNRCR